MLSPKMSSSAGKTSSQPSMRRFVAKLGPEGATAVRVAVSAISIARSFGLGATPRCRAILRNDGSRLRTHVVLSGARFVAGAQNDTVGTLSEFASRESNGLPLPTPDLRLVVRPLQRFEVLVRLHLGFATDTVRNFVEGSVTAGQRLFDRRARLCRRHQLVERGVVLGGAGHDDVEQRPVRRRL